MVRKAIGTIFNLIMLCWNMVDHAISGPHALIAVGFDIYDRIDKYMGIITVLGAKTITRKIT